MSAIAFLNARQLGRQVPRLIAETRALMLAREAAAHDAHSRTLRETLEQLSRSENSAIASEALRLMAPLRMLK